MSKRAVVSTIVTIILLIITGYLSHGVLLAGDYSHLSGLYRTQEEQIKYFPLMLPAHLAVAIALVWIFRRIRNQDPILIQGIRFGHASETHPGRFPI